MKTILDLRKGNLVYGTIHRNGGGVATNGGIVEQLEVRKIEVNLASSVIRVRLSCGYGVTYLHSLYDEGVYLTQDDAFDDVNKIYNAPNLHEFMKDSFGLEWVVNAHKSAYMLWRWDESKKSAVKCDGFGWLNLFDPIYPEGYYPTKEACEKANRRMVTIEVTRTYMTEREEGADAEYLLNNPDEYEFKEGDECISDAQYAD